MNINNLFKEGGRFYGFRSFFWVALVLLGWLVYSDISGWRIFSFGNQQNWSASGPGGYHK